MSKWQYFGERDVLYGGGTFFKLLQGRKFFFIRVENNEECCRNGNWRDEIGHHYEVYVSLVDLDEIGEKNILNAKWCCGQENEEIADDLVAFCCRDYGAYAPLQTFCGNNGYKLLREAKRCVRELEQDEDKLEDKLDNSSVNKLGMTAREFMKGDTASAITRGVLEGNPESCLIARMHGVPQDIIDDTRPEDWLPYFMGYMDGFSGSPETQIDSVAVEYKQGYKRGVRVREGKATKPSWIQHQETKSNAPGNTNQT